MHCALVCSLVVFVISEEFSALNAQIRESVACFHFLEPILIDSSL